MNKVEMAFNKGYRVDKDGMVHGIRVKTISTDLSGNNYQRFVIWTGTKYKKVYVHRLQAYQKFGHDMFQGGIQVRHLNGDKLDNSWDNIGIGTISENQMDIPADRRHATAVKRGRACSILTVEDVLKLRRLYEEEGWKNKELMVKFGVAHSTVSGIIHRKTWRDI